MRVSYCLSIETANGCRPPRKMRAGAVEFCARFLLLNGKSVGNSECKQADRFC
jgi:hypothetical protein